MKSDKEIWAESLDNEEHVDLFKTESGGPKLPKRQLFKTQQEKNLEKRVKNLEEQVETLMKDLYNSNQIIETLKKDIKIIKNKR